MALAEQLAQAAQAAAAFAQEGERVEGVLAVEPSSSARVYLCAFAREGGRAWLVVDADGAPVVERQRVRDAVSLAALCELAGEAAGDEPPRVASPAYLDEFGTEDVVAEGLAAVEALTEEVEAAYKRELR